MYMTQRIIMKIKFFLNDRFPGLPGIPGFPQFPGQPGPSPYSQAPAAPPPAFIPQQIGFNICCRSRGHFVLSVQEYFYLAKQWCEILVLPHIRRSAFCCRL